MMIEMKFALCCFVAQMSSKAPQVLELCLDHIADVDVAPVVDILQLVQQSELAAVDVINNNTASSLQWQLLIQLLHAAGPKLRIADLRDVALDREALRLVSTSTVPPNWLWHPCRLAF
jgi:hypothetical protein